MSDINVIVNDEIVNIDVIDEPVLVNVINSPGVPGAPGQGVPVGGTTGQVLAKNSNTNYDTEWVDVTGGAWGTITGTLSNQTDLQTALDGKFDDPTGTTSQYLRGDGSLATFPSLTGFVPYTGATTNVDLGTHRITAQHATISSSGSGDTVTLNHSSGSGIGLNITKGGNGEGLYINKTGGSGNAATIIGTINATTIVKSGGTSSQFLKADGTVDSSVYVPTSRELTINGVTYDLSANRSWTVAGGITGSGASGQVAYWTGTSAQSGSNNLFWDNANGRLGIGTNVPSSDLSILKSSTATVQAYIKNSSTGLVADTRIVIANDASLEGGFFIGSSTRTLDASSVLVYANRQMRFMTNNLVSTGGTDAIIFQAGGSNPSQEGMRVTGTKNILIGTTSDSGQRLQVQGTTLLNGNVTFSSATGMFWDATNSRLGIGTNAPQRPLHIYSNSGMWVQSPTGGNSILVITPTGFDTLNQNFIDFSITANSRMRLFSTGNLLIGSTTDSGERLQVTGNVRIVAGLNGLTVRYTASALEVATFTSSARSAALYLPNTIDSAWTNLIIRANSAQSANITEFQNSGGTVLSAFNRDGNLIIGSSSVNASAILQADSTTKGFLPPRMTNAQRTAISSPAVGLIVYCTDMVEGLYVYKSAGWTFVI